MNRRYFLVGIFLTCGLIGGMFFLRDRSLKTISPIVEEGKYLKAKGSRHAPVQIIEYTDYQCPACAYASRLLGEMYENYAGKIHLIYHHFPLKGHIWSPLAHQAAECANRQGRFWEYHDRLFANQREWSPSRNPVKALLVYAQQLGLDLDVFAACLTDPEVKEDIQKEKRGGDALKINATPTFFVNGERLVGGKQLQERGEEIIRETLGMKVVEQPVETGPAKDQQ